MQSATNKNKKRLVFYFTATGNSLYVARKFSDAPISIAQVLKGDNLTFEADEIGFVFPDYLAMAPEIVKRFVKKGTFKAPYIFSIITYGHFECNVVERWMRYAAQYGLRFDYIATILMVDNFLPGFDMTDELKIDKNSEGQIAQAVADVAEEKLYIPFLSDEERKRRQEFLEQFKEIYPIRSEDMLGVNDRCIGCGTCTQVCPRGNFKLIDKKAENSGECEFCLACVHACPQKAILLKGGEKNPDARYRHPSVTIKDIIQANKQ